mgnify:CR=1 FL=1
MFEYIALEVWRCSWIGYELRNGAAEADLDQLREIDRTVQGFGSRAAEQVINDLLTGSPSLRAAVTGGHLQVVGAYYEVGTGVVAFSEPVGATTAATLK